MACVGEFSGSPPQGDDPAASPRAGPDDRSAGTGGCRGLRYRRPCRAIHQAPPAPRQPSVRWAGVAQEIVARTTIDDVLKALDLERLDFIKADIEGWELRLLHGAESTLARFRPRLLLELTGAALARAGDRLDDAFAFLA